MQTPNHDDLLDLAKTLWGEARGEGRLGMRAVAHVVMNRVRDSRWPNTITEVCRQPKQFSCWNGQGLDAITFEQLVSTGCYGIAATVALHQDAISGDPSYGADHYMTVDLYESDGRPGWADDMPVTARIGRHVFMKAR